MEISRGAELSISVGLTGRSSADHYKAAFIEIVLPLWRSWWRSSWWSSRALTCCLLAYAVINVNLAASLIGHADHLLLGGGGALGGVAGRWENGLDGLDCPTLGRRGWGDIPLSSYMINLLFFWSLWRRWWWCFRADIGWCRRADVHAIVGNPLL